MRTKYASTRFGIVKRSKGQSAVDAASYISRSVLVSEYDGKTYRPKYHEDLVHCEINLPEYAPEEWLDRAVLWNSVELNEKQKNAQLCRTLKAALPNDWKQKVSLILSATILVWILQNIRLPISPAGARAGI